MVDYRCCTELDVKCRANFDDAPNLEFVAINGFNLPGQQTRDGIVPSALFYDDRLGEICFRKIDVRAGSDYTDPTIVSS